MNDIDKQNGPGNGVVSSALLGRVLVACEYSGVVRDAFAARGWDAWSCDLLPSEKPGQHYQCNVLDVLNGGWDIVIAHPPCTYLCSSGLHWNTRRPGRDKLTQAALDFVWLILHCDAHHVALENPVGRINTAIRKPDQIVQPWQFGHDASKATCLWLRDLPPLRPTNILPKPASGRWGNQTASGQNKLAPSPDRWKERSRTYLGLAEAMADQWTRATRPNTQSSATPKHGHV